MLSAVQRARLVQVWRRGLPAPGVHVLALAALVYRGGLALRRAAYATGLRRAGSASCPVVAVGNLTVGGTGKTPLVEVIARRISERGRRVVILSRGYGGRAGARPAAVSDGRRVLLSPAVAGDEPFLLARRLLESGAGVPVVVGRDRLRSGRWALPRFAPDVLLLDDGFQQMRLRKDLDIVCLDARAPWGGGGLFPRGGLREPRDALRRAGLIVLTHAAGRAELTELENEVRRWSGAIPIGRADYVVEGIEELGSGVVRAPRELGPLRLLAFAGIAVPESFASTLGESGITPCELVAFPDHHPYNVADRQRLEARARAAGATALVTTEKDAVRFPSGGGMPVWALRVRLRLEDPSGIWWATLDRHVTPP